MKRRDYLKKRDTFLRQDKVFWGIYLVCFFALLFGNIPFAAKVPKSWNTTYVVVLLIFLVGNAVITAWVGRRRMQQSGLVCKSCKKTLLGMPGNLAVTTGVCCHCGKEAFDHE